MNHVQAAPPSGGYGIDFSQPSEDVNAGLSFVAKKLLEHGVTSFCPTLVTSPPSVYHKVRPGLNQHQGPEELRLPSLCSLMSLEFEQENFFNLRFQIYIYLFQVLPQVRVQNGGADGAGVLGELNLSFHKPAQCFYLKSIKITKLLR